MRRRILSVMLTVYMVLMLMPQMAFAETLTYGDFEYNISGGNATITRYTGSDADVTIPGSIQHENVTYPVTAIGNDAFSFKEFNSVTIPDGVTSIGERAFYGCPLISSVVLPGSVTSVGTYAFAHCNSLYGVFISAESTISYERDSFPEQASIVKYSLKQSTHEAIITDIALARLSEDYYVSSVNIPEQICGCPVTEVAPEQRGKVGGHKCAGDGATCIIPQVCSICGSTFSPHSYTQENMTLDGALKSAGDCRTEATYYYSCIHCNGIEGDANHTFNGDKDSDNHTGSKVWNTTETQHKQYWNCCNAVVVNYVDHTWNSGVCSDCDYVCKHTGGEATCTSKATCDYCGEEYGNLDSLNHDLDNIRAKEATVIETGNIEYWQCKDCEKCFTDENGTDEISLEETVLRKLQPEIIDGVGQSVTEGSKDELIFRSNAAFRDFIRVELDESELEESCYSKEEGSTLITLDADFVSTLEAGEHTIGIVSDGGTAETTFTVKEAPAPSGVEDGGSDDSGSKVVNKGSVKTGDDTSLAAWIVLMLLSAAGAGGAAVCFGRKRTIK